MPAVKDPILVLSDVALVGGAGPTVSGFQDLRIAYGGIWFVEVTNGAQKQGKGVQAQAQVAPDQQAGNDFDFDCRHIAAQEATVKSKFVIRIPPEVPFTKLTIAHGDEDATVTARFVRLTQV